MRKPFKRGIENETILKKAKEFFECTSAGKAICEGIKSGKLIVCIRENYFNVYRNGCVLLTFKPGGTKHKHLVHKKYWHSNDYDNLVKSGEYYLSLNLEEDNCDSTKSFIEKIIKVPNDNLRSFLENKNKKSESEKELLQAYIDAENPCLIDLEVAFSCENMKEDRKRDYVAKRVDLAVLEKCDSGVVLRLIEAKVTSDKRLKAENTEPEIIHQMKEYETFLEVEEDEIKESYKIIAQNYVENFSYLIRQPKDKDLIKGFISNGSLDVKPSLLLIAKGTSAEGELQGTKGKNEGNHYKTLKDECKKQKWKLIEWSDKNE